MIWKLASCVVGAFWFLENLLDDTNSEWLRWRVTMSSHANNAIESAEDDRITRK